MDTTTLRREAACRFSGALDTAFLRALCEPVRADILTRMIQIGRADVATIAAPFDQDRSVISRHLQILRDAGVVFADQDGRHVYYEIDGPAVLARLRSLTLEIGALVATCCPGPGGRP